MTKRMLTLRVESPLALHQRRASEQFAPTLDYIPGSTVRGAIADCYLGGVPERARDRTFQQLFMRESVLFSDCFPIKARARGFSYLLPASAVACKRNPEHESESLGDSILRLQLCQEMESPAPLEEGDWQYCSECKKHGRREKRDRMESGYYSSLAPYERIGVSTRMITGVAVSRRTGTAAHGLLFSHDVIEESDSHNEVIFRGLMTVPDALRSELEGLAPYGHRLAVGYGRSRGLGGLTIKGWDTPPAEHERLTVAGRFDRLNMAAKELWPRFDRKLDLLLFTITLQSHLALRDGGEPVLDEANEIVRQLGLPGDVTRCRSLLQAVAVPGWNSAINLPKPDTWALKRGSVMLFRVGARVDEQALMRRLEQIENEGLGERRAEGFGRVLVCDPFHYCFLERELQGG